MMEFFRLELSSKSVSRVLPGVMLLGLLASLGGVEQIAFGAPPLKPPFYVEFQQGQQALQQRNWGEAEAHLRQSMAMKPDDAMICMTLAFVVAQQGRTAEATSLYKRAATMDAQDPMIYYSLGALQEQVGDYTGALDSYQKTLKRMPTYTYGFLALARVQSLKEQWDASLASYEAFLAKYPNHYEARRNLGHLQLGLGKPELASQTFEKLKQDFPQRFQEQVAYAKALTLANDPGKALDVLKSVNQGDMIRSDVQEEMGRAYDALGQTAYAVEGYRKAYVLNPEKSYLILRAGEMLYAEKSWSEALGYYQTYLQQHPQDPMARWMVANIQIEKQDYPQAVQGLSQLFQEVQGLNAGVVPAGGEYPPVYKLKHQLALAYQLNQEPLQAIPLYESLWETSEGKGDAQLQKNLALAYHQTQALEKALPLYRGLYQQALGASKNLPDVKPTVIEPGLVQDYRQTLTVLAKNAQAQKKYSDALAYYQELETAFPEDTQVQLAMAELWTAQGDPAKAYERYQALLLKSPDNLEYRLARNQLLVTWKKDYLTALTDLELLEVQNQNNTPLQLLKVQIFQALNRHDDAKMTLERLTQGDPQNAQVWAEYGAYLHKHGDLPGAQAAYEKAFQLNGLNPTTAYNLATVYYLQERLNEAFGYYEKSLTLDPHFWESRYGIAVILERRQELDKAIRNYEAFLQGRPDSPNAAAVRDHVRELKSMGAPDQSAPQTSSPNESQ